MERREDNSSPGSPYLNAPLLDNSIPRVAQRRERGKLEGEACSGSKIRPGKGGVQPGELYPGVGGGGEGEASDTKW